jgi:uncharacterized membrane protein YkoI
MQSALTKRLYWIVALVGLLASASTAISVTARFAFAGGSGTQAVAQACENEDKNEADDGAEEDVDEAGDNDGAGCEDEDESGGIEEADDDDNNEARAASGQLDDGAGLLPQAGITLEEAIAAAQSAASGAIGEVDLEHYQGKLVFNVDVRDRDVKIDAANGSVLAVTADD